MIRASDREAIPALGTSEDSQGNNTVEKIDLLREKVWNLQWRRTSQEADSRLPLRTNSQMGSTVCIHLPVRKLFASAARRTCLHIPTVQTRPQVACTRRLRTPGCTILLITAERRIPVAPARAAVNKSAILRVTMCFSHGPTQRQRLSGVGVSPWEGGGGK